MRIIVDERDSGFVVYHNHGGRWARWRVTLDRAEVGHCITADEELGEVEICEMEGGGRLKVDRENGGVVRRWLRGRVVVERREGE